MLLSAEGRIEHEKLNQGQLHLVEFLEFNAERENRVEQKKLNQEGSNCPTAWVFCWTRPSADTGTDYNQHQIFNTITHVGEKVSHLTGETVYLFLLVLLSACVY